MIPFTWIYYRIPLFTMLFPWKNLGKDSNVKINTKNRIKRREKIIIIIITLFFVFIYLTWFNVYKLYNIKRYVDK